MSERMEDSNGFWLIEDKPISKAGVFPYLGAFLPKAPDPTRVYMVLRPPQELGRPETVDSFKLQPWVIDHDMLGPHEKGLLPPERKGVHGVIGEKVYFNAKDGTLYANIKCFSEQMKNDIEQGIRGLSAGYFHDLDWESGVYNGQPYDAVQRNISCNHLALVPRGRMGKDVALDHADYDILGGNAMDIITGPRLQTAESKEQSMTLEELAALVKSLAARIEKMEGAGAASADTASAGTTGSAEAGSAADGKAGGQDSAGAAGQDGELTIEALAEAVKGLAERLDRAEAGKNASGDNAGAASKDGADAKGAAGSDEAGEAAKDGKEDEARGHSMDAALVHKNILKDMSERERLVRELTPRVGSFDHDLMTSAEVAAYGCKKLGLKCLPGQESAVLQGYLQGAAQAPGPVFSMDSAGQAAPLKGSAALESYLKGDK
ncbi:DUF2213 domain-containing protein [Desulfovibrio sp. OttesenSCG-928-C14]|nr:DUF2213 domain-containing protein [Desulfovibrio sp. OttesenSCG-928-C14]